MIKKVFQGLFYGYIFILALFVAYRVILGSSYGGTTVKFEQQNKRCAAEGTDWSFCQFSNDNTDRRVILYVLHAKGQDGEFWERPIGYSSLLQKYWDYNKSKRPLIVTISFGKRWIVTDTITKNPRVTIERFKSEIIPAIEKVVGKPTQRFIMGESMGGLNAITLSMGLPTMFSRIVALCPPLYNVSPFDGWKQLTQFAVSSGASPKNLMEVVGMGRTYFANNKEWLEFSPIEKIKNVRFKPKQHFYLAAGLKDEYGAFDGTRHFLKGLRRSGVITHWKPNSGGHCAVDVESLGRFLKF